MHHLGRHSVACFLTRGDLYVSWEKGMAVFEELLIDQVRTAEPYRCRAVLRDAVVPLSYRTAVRSRPT